MLKTKFSTKGQVVIPKAIRERAAVAPGVVYDVDTDGRRIVLTPRASYRDRVHPVSLEEFLEARITYSGPALTDEDIRKAGREAAVRRYEQSGG